MHVSQAQSNLFSGKVPEDIQEYHSIIKHLFPFFKK